MKLHYSDIPEGGLHIAFRGEEAGWEGLKDFSVEEGPSGDVLVRKRGRNVVIEGKVRATLGFECSRCLERFSYPVEAVVRQVLHPSGEGKVAAREIELNSSDLEEGTYDEEDIPVKGVVVEHLLLSLPMRPLCDEDCKGLCPICGANRNAADCGCHEGTTGSPLDCLKDFVVKAR